MGPIKDEERELPLPPRQLVYQNAAVLCSAAAGTCDHLDCHHRPFLMGFVCTRRGKTLVYAYSFDADAGAIQSALSKMFTRLIFRRALYFGNLMGNTVSSTVWNCVKCRGF